MADVTKCPECGYVLEPSLFPMLPQFQLAVANARIAELEEALKAFVAATEYAISKGVELMSEETNALEGAKAALEEDTDAGT